MSSNTSGIFLNDAAPIVSSGSSTESSSENYSVASLALLSQSLEQLNQVSMSLGSSNAAAPVVLPLPPIAGFDPASVPVPNMQAAHTYEMDGYMDQLQSLFQDLYYKPGDSAALARLMTFYARLEQAGGVTPEVTAFLDKYNFAGLVDSAMQQFALLSLFSGYGTPPVNGQAGVHAFTDAMTASLNENFPNATDKFIIEMKNDIAAGYDNLIAAHVDASGNLYWNYGSYTDATTGQSVAVRYQWPADQDLILVLASNSGMTGIPNSYWKDFDWTSFRQDMKTGAMDALLAKYKDPLLALSLWFVMSTDNENQGQLGGYGSATSLLTDMTDKYASRMAALTSQLAGSSFTGDQALEFAKLFFASTATVQIEQSVSSISDAWVKNVYKTIGDIQVKINGTQMSLGVAMGQAINGTLSKDALALAMRALIPAAPATGIADPTLANSYYSTMTGWFDWWYSRPPGFHPVPDSALEDMFQYFNPPINASMTEVQYKSAIDAANRIEAPDRDNLLRLIRAKVPNSAAWDQTTGSTDAPDYTTMLNAVQQAGTLLTNQSKTVATQVAAITNIINIALKLGSTIATVDGGGPVTLMKKLVDNQISR